MKKIAYFVITAVLLAAPAFAADPSHSNRMPSTIGKQYKEKPAAQTEQATETLSAEDVQNITPAAGGAEEKAPTKEKSFKEELRLPRKN